MHLTVFMSSLDRLLSGALPDPDGPGRLTVPTKAVAIDRGLVDRARAELSALGLSGRIAVVSDPTTREVLGQEVERALSGLGRVDPVVLGEQPKADQAVVEPLSQSCHQADVLVAVGSGTINDLCKCVAAESGKPYVVFGTAPSMNGYSSTNAAIMVDGLKVSRQAVPPLGVFLDLDILAAAPVRLIRSGLGDSLCRPTVQVDWLLAHLILDRPYRSAPFALLEDDEEILFDAPEGAVSGDLETMAALARALVLSGFGMTICEGSEPASQGEHLLAHYVEMVGRDLPESYHGEQIGVTTLIMDRLQESLLSGPAPRLEPNSVTAADLANHFGAELGAACWRAIRPKLLNAEACRQINERLASGWTDIRQRVAAVRRSSDDLSRVLNAIGAPVRFDQLGWSVGLMRDALIHARLTRNRYTALDLAADSGHLSAFLSREAPNG